MDYYAAHWMGAWNHGLMQDIKLLTIGCGYPPGAFGGDALRWRQTAVAQLTDAFEPNPLGPAIDPQGAVNEQATLYENRTPCGRPRCRAGRLRIPATGLDHGPDRELPAFLGSATEPDGDLVQIGDSYVERPATSAHGSALVSVSAGRIRVWPVGVDAAASFYSLRFGPGRESRDNDHMGVTYYARGRDLIVDAGHDGYAATPYRTWLQSPEAASTLVLPGTAFNPTPPPP